jgi:hypothetical protein
MATTSTDETSIPATIAGCLKEWSVSSRPLAWWRTNHNCSTFILLLSKPWMLLVFHDESKELKVPSKVHPGFSRTQLKYLIEISYMIELNYNTQL